MSVDEGVKIAEGLGRILNGNAVGFFVMVAAIIAMAYLLHKLWSMVEKRLDECERQHEECQKQNVVLTQAIMDLADGNKYEAKGRIQAAQAYTMQS